MYNKRMKCSCCGFVEVQRVNVSGDFDGWDPKDLICEPEACSFCNHLVSLAAKQLEWIQQELKKHF